MKRNKNMLVRLKRLCPARPVGGGVLYIEDIESGAVRIDELPRGGGGYLLVPRPCATIEEWLRTVAEQEGRPVTNIIHEEVSSPTGRPAGCREAE